MPYFSIQTSKALDKTSADDLAVKASDFISKTLGKPEAYVMTAVVHSVSMSFGGSVDAPAALACLKSIGLQKERCADLSKAICGFLEKELGVAPDRAFIDFNPLDGGYFGWNNKTF